MGEIGIKLNIANTGIDSSIMLICQSRSSILRRARVLKVASPTFKLNRPFFYEGATAASELIQSGMGSIHTTTGIPWWATFSVSTIIVKVTLFPLIRSQLLANVQLQRAMPEINLLFQLLKRRLLPLQYHEVDKRFRLLMTFIKGSNACLIVNSASVAAVFFYPLSNLGFFVMFVYSLRDMVKGDMRQIMQEGGMLWFEDLTVRDPTYLLPLTAIALSYAAIEVSFSGRGPQSRVLLIIKDTLQTAVIFSLPLISFLPSGIFCYWIPSSAFAICQSKLLRYHPFLKMLNLPVPKALPVSPKIP